MPAAVMSPRERVLWLAGFALVAAALVISRFTSADPDSSLYAAMSARLSALPVAHWIAPYWWSLWPGSGMTQLFREHPAGVFLLPAALARLGVPGEQAAYIVGIAAGLLSLWLLATLVARVTSREEGRAVLILLQLMPVAFIFRIRANHEYPMLVCLLLCLVGLDNLARSWRGLGLVVMGVVGGLLIKGVFVVLILLASGLWILTNPTRRSGVVIRQLTACIAAVVLMGAAILVYDALCLRVVGETFWGPYWRRQMGPITISSPLDDARTLGTHLLFYATRLLWHPAPWSLALIWAGWREWRSRNTAGSTLNEGERRALYFSIAFAVLAVLVLSLPSRFAERYTFSATYVIAACGAVVAWRIWPPLRALIGRLDAAVPALPAMVWTGLMLLRLSLGPFLPRIQDH